MLLKFRHTTRQQPILQQRDTSLMILPRPFIKPQTTVKAGPILVPESLMVPLHVLSEKIP